MTNLMLLYVTAGIVGAGITLVVPFPLSLPLCMAAGALLGWCWPYD